MQREFVRLYQEYVGEFTGSIDSHKALETKLSNQLDQVEEFLSTASNDFEKNEIELLKLWNIYVHSGKSLLSASEAKMETEFFGLFE